MRHPINVIIASLALCSATAFAVDRNYAIILNNNDIENATLTVNYAICNEPVGSSKPVCSALQSVDIQDASVEHQIAIAKIPLKKDESVRIVNVFEKDANGKEIARGEFLSDEYSAGGPYYTNCSATPHLIAQFNNFRVDDMSRMITCNEVFG